MADPKTKRVLDILPNRKYLTEYFSKISRDIRKKVQLFISDMWTPYKDISIIFFKRTEFIVDKYYWIRQVIWVFENVRKEEQKKFKQFRKNFKCSKSLLMKRFDFLSDEDKQKVNINV